MKSFKVGDRVRIVCPQSMHFGKQATITEQSFGFIDATAGDKTIEDFCYRVDIDGVGLFTPDHFYNGFPPQDLEPIVNPDETAWNEFRRYLQPDPIILAKEPA